MNKRFSTGFAAAALVISACGPAATVSSTTTTATPEVPEAMVLSYDLSAGTSFSYRVDLDEHVDMSADGDAVFAAEEYPGQATVDISGSATFTHEISDGPDPDTYEVHITGEFTDISVTGTVDGEDIATGDGQVPDFADLEPIDITFVVDSQGNIIEPESSTLDDPFSSLFGDLGSVGSGMTMLEPGQFVGPPLTDDEVTVGDTWTETTETPLFGDDVVTTTITSTVTGTDVVEGHDVLVIETDTEVSPISIDLAEFLVGFLGGFMDEGQQDEDMTALLDQIVFVVEVSDAGGLSTTLFDPVAGVARHVDVDAGASVSLDMRVPDEGTQELTQATIRVDLAQRVTFTLLGATGA